MKRIAIIGATGAIGTALLERCIAQGTEAYVLVRPDSKRISSLPESDLIHLVWCGMEDMADLDTATLPQCDVFYHFAWGATHGTDARNDMSTQIQNIQYTIDAVHLAHRLGCKKFVGSGSQAEYGRVEGILQPETPCNPENGYGMAKLCAGEMSRVECGKYGISHVWGRVLSIYGPKDGMHTMVSSVIRSALDGVAPKCTKGEQLWDYLYSGDVGEAFYRIGAAGKNGAVYVIGSGNARPLADYIRQICRTANPELEPEFGAIPYMDKQVMHLQADITALSEDTGFRPQVSFEDGIAATVAWYKTALSKV